MPQSRKVEEFQSFVSEPGWRGKLSALPPPLSALRSPPFIHRPPVASGRRTFTRYLIWPEVTGDAAKIWMSLIVPGVAVNFTRARPRSSARTVMLFKSLSKAPRSKEVNVTGMPDTPPTSRYTDSPCTTRCSRGL